MCKKIDKATNRISPELAPVQFGSTQLAHALVRYNKKAKVKT